VSALQVTWFIIIGLFLTVYAILDGFDLGAGFWHLFVKKDEERRTVLSAIGPFWNGNEVWLLTGGGAIFAAFPHVYATVFSGMYLALMLVIFSLIFRALSIEFRNKVDSGRWRKFWDVSFAAGSILPAILFGVATGNILRGLKLNVVMNYAGSFFDLLNPYALFAGLLSLSLFALQGASFIAARVQGEQATRAKEWTSWVGIGSAATFLIFIVVTIITQPHLMQNYYNHIWLFALPLAALVSLLKAVYFIRKQTPWRAFAASSFAIVSVLTTIAVMLFPNTVIALGNPGLNLTVMNSSSSPLTLTVMLIIAAIGMPLVISYHVWSYKLWKEMI